MPNPSIQNGRAASIVSRRTLCWPAADLRRLEGAYRNVDVSSRYSHSPWAAVSELERLKEQVAYLKLWQGVMVVTDISLVGWLASAADGTRPLLVALAVVAVVLVTVGIVMAHRHIERRIDQIGKL